jgi:hypothetical protein
LFSSSIGVRAQSCTPVAAQPTITIDNIALVNAGQVVKTYDDNAFVDPQYDTVQVHWRGWSLCTIGAWGRIEVGAEIDGKASGMSYSFSGGTLGGSGCAHSNNLIAPPSPFSLPPGQHTLQVVGYAATEDCNGSVPVKSRPVTLWVGQDMASSGFEPSSCELPEVSSATEIGKPVNISTGKMYHEMVDLSIQGPIPIGFSRRFDSRSILDGAMGYGWQHSYMVRLEDLSSDTTRTLVDSQVRRVRFNCAVGTLGSGSNPDPGCLGVWHPNGYDHLKLTEGGEFPWSVEDKHGKTWAFDTTGRLMSIADRHGNTVTIAYNGATTTVTDQFGRGLSIASVGGRVDHISAGDRTVRYIYETSGPGTGNLLQVKASGLSNSPSVNSREDQRSSPIAM